MDNFDPSVGHGMGEGNLANSASFLTLPDVERAQFADNALRYEASVQFVSGQMKAMLTAIQG